jgi:hypothetical protein
VIDSKNEYRMSGEPKTVTNQKDAFRSFLPEQRRQRLWIPSKNKAKIDMKD